MFKGGARALSLFRAKVGLPAGTLPVGALPSADTVCNGWWQGAYQRAAVLEFTRDRCVCVCVCVCDCV